MDARFITYLAVSAVLIVTPGPDMVLVARNAIMGGYPAARSTAFGVGAGILLWGVFSAIGLAAALAASAALFVGVKLAGAAFLVALGIRSLWAAARAKDVPIEAGRPTPVGGWGMFVQGLIGNLLNPKAGAIFVAVVPQFHRAHRSGQPHRRHDRGLRVDGDDLAQRLRVPDREDRQALWATDPARV